MPQCSETYDSETCIDASLRLRSKTLVQRYKPMFAALEASQSHLIPLCLPLESLCSHVYRKKQNSLLARL